MQKELRLRKSQDFSLVYQLGKSWSNELLVLKALPSNADSLNRFGFTVGKRTGNAVIRNRIKRRLREATRHIAVKDGWDLIFIARGKSRSASYHHLQASLRGLLRRANLLDVVSETEKAKS